MTIFGRDSLIVSLQNMLVHAGFARGVLKKLAELQATALDDWRDASPARSPMRFGSANWRRPSRSPTPHTMERPTPPPCT